MAIFPINHNGRHQFSVPLRIRNLDTQTLGVSVIGSFVLGYIFWELWPFFQFFIMADTNFPLTLSFIGTFPQLKEHKVDANFPLNYFFHLVQFSLPPYRMKLKLGYTPLSCRPIFAISAKCNKSDAT